MLINTKLKLFNLNLQYLSTKPPPIFSYKEQPSIDEIKHDYIGPPDSKSNIRPILRHLPERETKLQKILRLERTTVAEWNQEFWTNHNKRFYQEKEDFIAANKTTDCDTISADRMSVFYKSFLDKNYKMHVYYNISWYIKNFTLLYLATLVNLEKLYKRNR